MQEYEPRVSFVKHFEFKALSANYSIVEEFQLYFFSLVNEAFQSNLLDNLKSWDLEWFWISSLKIAASSLFLNCDSGTSSL